MTQPIFDPRHRFRGFLRAQLQVLLLCLLAASVFAPLQGLLALAWGGAIGVLASAWAGFQLWLHPRNNEPVRAGTASIRAEVGRVTIMLLSVWLTFSHWPGFREALQAGMMLGGLFLVQVTGWIWLARETGEEGNPPH